MAKTNDPRGPGRPPASMPERLARRRAAVDGTAASYERIKLTLRTISPLFGGGSKPRELDPFDAIRGPTVRGHLRFWWRATRGHLFADAKSLADREAELFGQAAGDEGGRSAIEVHVSGVSGANNTMTHDELSSRDEHGGKYVLWVAARNNQQAAAEMVRPGLEFKLTVDFPADARTEIEQALKGWIRFGGYGGRTRRGAGSLTVVGTDEDGWLPAEATPDALFDFLEPDERDEANDMPVLAGAGIAIGTTGPDSMKSFEVAAGWMRSFRQGGGGQRGADSDRAPREPGTRGPKDKRLGRSRWPEADKVRRLHHRSSDHEPLHDRQPAWPRAGFGLPIIGQFQRSAREGGRLHEPDDFELRWRQGREGRDRLASPVIIKPIALADGRFAPLALWFDRAYPDGEVYLYRHPRADQSAAPFDRLLGDDDDARFGPLDLGRDEEQGRRLRTAFFFWLEDTRRAKAVAQ